ncbi:hypothetical protein BC828DRAFT_374366 [Blastocladiella britannica]|nr:hypothetical protein BC828DRAFT_374366 [Blastocladiella britannica]
MLRIPVPRPEALLQRVPTGGLSLPRPVEVATFSIDEEGTLHHDERSLRYWDPPSQLPVTVVAHPSEATAPMVPPAMDVNDPIPAEVDLTQGLDTWDPRALGGIEPLDNLLHALVHSRQWPGVGQGAAANLVTWRGIVVKLMTSVYPDRGSDGWELGATMHRGTLFMCEHVTPAAQAAETASHADPARARPTYAGYRFEHLSTNPIDPSDINSVAAEEALAAHRADRTHTAPSPRAQFCTVVQTRIGGRHRVVVGAEVDCCRIPPVSADQNEDDASRRQQRRVYMELKTHRAGAPARGWRAKLLRVWAQSYLAGVPEVLVGYRDDVSGAVVGAQRIGTLQVPEIVRYAASEDQYRQPQQRQHRSSNAPDWDPNACLMWAGSVLDVILDAACNRPEGTYLTVRYVPQQQCIEMEDVRPPYVTRDVLPAWFLQLSSS